MREDMNLERLCRRTCLVIKVSKGAEIRNRYNQAPRLTKDINRNVTNSQLDTTNESQEESCFTAMVSSLFARQWVMSQT